MYTLKSEVFSNPTITIFIFLESPLGGSTVHVVYVYMYNYRIFGLCYTDNILRESAN